MRFSAKRLLVFPFRRSMEVLTMLLFAVQAHAASTGGNLLTNPGFEQVQSGQAEAWKPYEKGYAVVEGAGHAGARCIQCVNTLPNEGRGAVYNLTLNQRAPTALLVTGWSRAENVDGSPDVDYSIYVDLLYADGTPLWGQTAPFSTGTHDWQQKQVLIRPTKPVRSAAIHALFRNHTGTAMFDDFTAVEIPAQNVFDEQVVGVPLLPEGATWGWFARDVAANSDVLPLVLDGKVTAAHSPELGLKFYPEPAEGPKEVVAGTLEDTRGEPRAVTLYYVERFAVPEAVWWNDIRQAVPTVPQAEYSNQAYIGKFGAKGTLSVYPFGCVTGARSGRAVGVPPFLGARMMRIGYNASAGLLYVAFDFSLIPENVMNNDGHGHGRAKAAVVRYDVDPQWGFRDAAATYYRLFPEAFARRTAAEGIWIPFTDPATIEGLQDFSVAYHEGDNSIVSDDKLGILSFRYTEPTTYWMPMARETPRNYDEAVNMVREDASGKDENKRRWAQAVLNSGTLDENGRFNVEFRDTPWCDGALWVLNANPQLPHGENEWTKGRLNYDEEMGNRLYGPSANGVLDGEFLDSLEGWGEVPDYRPESLRYAQTPPTFTTETYRPVIPTFFSTYEFATYLRGDLLGRDKLLMANGAAWRLFVFAPLLDVLGTETNWLIYGNTWNPDSDATFNLRRTLCYHKPYILLQDADFDKFGPEQVEKYFRRSMFYGVYPSMFSADAATNPYWKTPRWYNRDRALFKKYIPAIQRLSAAGWEPITYAKTDSPSVFVERYGTEYLTILNSTSAPVNATVSIDLTRFLPASASGAVQVSDLVSGETITTLAVSEAARLSLNLLPEEVRALRFSLIQP